MIIFGCEAKEEVVEQFHEKIKAELRLISHRKEIKDLFVKIVNCGKKVNGVGSYCLLSIGLEDPFEEWGFWRDQDLPDVDIDFSDDRRELALDYLKETYGKDRTARLGSVSIYKPKVVLNEATAALCIPSWKANSLKDSVDKNLREAFETTDEGRSLIDEFPELWVASEMEGHPRHAGQHAAGVVVTRQPLSYYAAKDSRTGALMVDKEDAEELNLLKIDCLGLTQLSIFDDCLEMAGKSREWLKTYPLDDEAVFDVARKGRFTGVFQFQGGAVQGLAQQIKMTEFGDIVALTALARPGPLNSGGSQQWIDRKNGRKKVEYLHPSLEPFLSSTLGVLTYQEQVMKICREVGKMSWPDVSAVRRVIGKSKGREALEEYHGKFKAGCIESGLPEEAIDEIWSTIVTHGAYSFNLSHSVAYSFITYWCLVLKHHFPLYFAAATLRRESDPSNQLRLLRELADEGIKYTSFDKDHSTDKWEVVGNSLIGPLTGIKGIGPRMAETIMEIRASGGQMPERVKNLIQGAATEYDRLYPIREKFPGLYEFPGPYKLNEPLTNIDEIPQGADGFYRIVGKVIEITERDHNEKAAVDRRGYEMKGPTKWMAVKVVDDTGEFFCQIDRYNFGRLGSQIVEQGLGVVWLFAGTVGKNFHRLSVKKMKMIGKIDD